MYCKEEYFTKLIDKNKDGPNQKSMYIKPVDIQEILNCVRESKSKVSADCDELMMMTVKRIISAVIEPFTYIYITCLLLTVLYPIL